ncbi:MAG: NUDIX domain-containing protein [Kangiellaceae bacterium]|jgi:ADP-ribose pyrophosphatase|nr:NUDIX domain-containing protein [Kangiellaceae bacterium]
MKFDIKQQHVVFDGFFQVEKLLIDHQTFAGDMVCGVEREVFRRGEAVGVLCVDRERRKLVMVEQFRVGCAVANDANPWLIELVAGIVEPGERVADVAARECFEETGCRPRSLKILHQYWVSPGGSDEKFYLFLALVDSSECSETAGLETEHEDIKVHIIDFDDAFSRLASGQINNAMTILGLQWLMLNQSQLA